ncbi:MAG TPA: hypothetical protein VED40_06955 [Azospirillaceae bacterium]|nr:hypothetical protein [Azospirillaceae bacterium]
MATNAEIAARLLRDAAAYFREVAGKYDATRPQMEHNARAFEAVAELVERDPTAPFGDEKAPSP